MFDAGFQHNMPHRASSIDQQEIARFAALAENWWDTQGPMRALHAMMPARLSYLKHQLCSHFERPEDTRQAFEGLHIADIGCGAGLVSEPLARLGATVTALDAATENITVARQHAADCGLEIDYRAESVENLAATGAQFDVVVAMEVIEHVADLAGFLAACAEILKPGGAMVLSTINRTLLAYGFAILGAEKIARIVPQGTHQYDKFVTPSELRRHLKIADVTLRDITGLNYRPISAEWRLGGPTRINYLAFATG